MSIAPRKLCMDHMPMLLRHGRYEVLKATVHGAVLTLTAVCALYNLAAWMARRQRHSWVNATVYAALTVWEYHHVQHHLRLGTPSASAPQKDRAVA